MQPLHILVFVCLSCPLWAISTGDTFTLVSPSAIEITKLTALTSAPASTVQNGRVYKGGNSYYTSIPVAYQGLEVVQTTQSLRSDNSSDLFALTILKRSEVFIIGTTLPLGMNGFTMVPMDTITANMTDAGFGAAVTFNIYTRTYDQGVVILSGCGCAGELMFQIAVRPIVDEDSSIYGFSYIVAGAVVIGGGVFIVATIIGCCWYRRWRRGKKTRNETLKRLAGSSDPKKIIPKEDIKLGEALGEGFSGIVYKSRWHGTEVAAKRMRNQQDTAENKKTFEMETFVHEKLLGHPRVVNFLGACYTPPDLTIVMELYSCGSVEDVLIRDRKFPVHNKLSHKELKTNLETIIRLAVDASSGLLHCHYSFLIHRDVRAANFLVTIEHGLYRATISDFGLSRFLDKDKAEGDGDDGERLPMLWMSPEATLYNKFSSASDVYMFGAFLFELFARVRPFTGIGMATIMRMKQLQQVDVRPMIPENCPLKLRKMISECWHYDAASRPNMQDINDRLVDLQREVENCQPHDVLKTFGIGAEPEYPVETVEYKESSDTSREDANYSAYHKVGYVQVEGDNKNTRSTGKTKENIYDTPYMEMTTTKATRATATSSAFALASVAGGGLGSAHEELTKQHSTSASLGGNLTTPLLPATSSSDTASTSDGSSGVSKENVSSVSALINAFGNNNNSGANENSPSDKGSSPNRLTGTKESMRLTGTKDMRISSSGTDASETS